MIIRCFEADTKTLSYGLNTAKIWTTLIPAPGGNDVSCRLVFKATRLCAPIYAQVHSTGKMTVASFLSHTTHTRYVCMTAKKHVKHADDSVYRGTHQDDVSNYYRCDHKRGGHHLRRKLHHKVVIFHVLATVVIDGLEQPHDGGAPVLKLTENKQRWKRSAPTYAANCYEQKQGADDKWGAQQRLANAEG